MKTITQLAILSICLAFCSCVEDKATQVPPAQSATVAKANNRKQAEKPAPKRPTENIKVNLPGQKPASPKPTTSSKAVPTAKGQETNEYLGLSEEEQKIARQRELEMAKYENDNPTNKPKSKATPVVKGGLPSACDLISPEFLSKTMGVVEARDIYVKDGSGKKAVHSKSCFFKWDESSTPNAGVLLQVQKNPVEDEFPDWASYYIRAKRDQGDVMPDGSGTYRYKDFPGMGKAGAYNYNLARYTWRTESDNIFMVAFNLPSSEAQQLIWAEKIGKEAMRNFAKIKN